MSYQEKQHVVARSPWRVTPDVIPGALAWAALALAILGVLFYPRLLLIIAATLAFYSALRFVLGMVGILRGLRLIEQATQTDWRTQHTIHADALPWDAVTHVVIIPTYNEPLHILQKSLDTLAQSAERGQMVVVLAMEARAPHAERRARSLQAAYSATFKAVHYTLHPDNIPGEKRCKSANQAWAARWIKRELIDRQGYDMDHIVVTTMDADTLWHAAYFSALTYYFTTDLNRHQRFWQAPIRYHSNVWQVNPLLRLVNTYATAFELAFLSLPGWFSMPMSSYSLSLRLLHQCDYWDGDVIADEWHMFIKAYFRHHGTISVTPIHLPFLAAATTGDTLKQTIINRYQQSLRHAWGSKEFGYALHMLLHHPRTPHWRGLRILSRIVHDVILPCAGWLIVVIGTQLPLLFHADLRDSLLNNPLDYPEFILLHASIAIFTLLSILMWMLDLRVRPPRPHRATKGEWLLIGVGFVVMPILTALFMALPLLDAQTRLLFGSSLAFRVTEKTAI